MKKSVFNTVVWICLAAGAGVIGTGAWIFLRIFYGGPPAAPGEYPKYATEVVYHAADFSGDGEKVYFLKEVIGWKQVKPRGLWDGHSVEERHLWLCSVRSDGKDRKQIAELFPGSKWILNKTEGFVELAVCPKNDRIAWASFGCMPEIDGLWVMDADGENFKKLMDEPKDSHIGNPAWSPDGQWVFVAMGLAWVQKIWKLRSDGYEKVCLSPGPGEVRPSISPHGKQIAFTKVEDLDPVSTELWVMDIDGKNRRKILGADKIDKWNRRWLPDGERIIFWDAIKGNMVVDVQTGKAVQLKELPGDKVSPKEDYALSVGSQGFFVSPRGSVKPEDPYFGFENKYEYHTRLKDELAKVPEVW